MFERYVVVDWSANSTPKRGRDSIWIAALDADGLEVANPTTRSEAMGLLDRRIAAAVGPTLVGFDFSLGYPAGTAAALGLGGIPWEATWAHLTAEIVDGERNRNNRFDVASRMNEAVAPGLGPFWGCPPSKASATLSVTKPTEVQPVEEWRAVERTLREAARRPFSSWQLAGAGAVGSQSLLGIPAVAALRASDADRVAVWPFTTGLRVPELRPDAVVIAEVWPSLRPVVVRDGDVRDRAQVEAVARWLHAADHDGELVRWFAPCVSDAVARDAESEEGWILGVVP